MSNKEKLMETFDFDSEKTKRLLKKAKILTTIRTSVISIIIFVLLCVSIITINMRLLNDAAMNLLVIEQIMDTIARPNIYMGQYKIRDGFLTGELEYSTYRIVGNKAVYNGTYSTSYNIIPIVSGVYGCSGRGQLLQIKADNGYVSFNNQGLKEMAFYHPYLEYKTYQNDLILLDEIDDSKYLEMSISFDDEYSLEEIKSMLPGELKLAWFWVNTYSLEDLNKMKGQYVEIKDDIKQNTVQKTYQEPKVLFANQVYGMKGIDAAGEVIDDPRNAFIEAVESALKMKYKQTQFRLLYDYLSASSGKIFADDIKIIGAVVTGDLNSIRLLKDLSFIKAATLGTVIDKF